MPGLLYVAALALLLFASEYYPTLDGGLFFSLCAGALIVVPTGWLVFSRLRNRLGADLPKLRAVWTATGSLLLLLSIFLLVNGAFDRASTTVVTATVVAKRISTGKYSATRTLRVRSWRAGHEIESLNVSRWLFDAVREGDMVTLTAHKGFLGMPWYGTPIPKR
jgi:hypothetical protein